MFAGSSKKMCMVSFAEYLGMNCNKNFFDKQKKNFVDVIFVCVE